MIIKQNWRDVHPSIAHKSGIDWRLLSMSGNKTDGDIDVMELFKSRRKDSDIYRSIALMRHGFGGHPFGKDEYISKERKFSKINKI